MTVPELGGSRSSSGAREGIAQCGSRRSYWYEDFFPQKEQGAAEQGLSLASPARRRGESQNHSMVGVGRDLCGSSSPTPYRSRVT